MTAISGEQQPAAVAPKSWRTLLWTSTLYFGEGLPWTFLHQMGTEFLTNIGASMTQISATSWLHFAVTFKFVWSPVVDLFGKKRTWVWVMQVVLGLGMLAIAPIAPIAAAGRLWLFWLAMSLFAILHATHDIACDGFYLQALNKHDQALYVGTRNAAYRAALYVGSWFLVALAARRNWTTAFGLAGIIMIATAIVNALVMPNPPKPGAMETARMSAAARRAAFWEAYRTFLKQPKAGLVLSLMFFYRLGDIMMGAMSKGLLRDIGVDLAHRATLNGITFWASIGGALIGSGLIARIGFERCLVPLTYIQNLAIPLYVGLAVFKPHFAGVVAIVIAEQVASGIGTASHSVFLMRRSKAAFSASHYAFATAVVSAGSAVAGGLSGPLNQAVGHTWAFTLAFVASWPSLILVLFVPKTSVDAPVVPSKRLEGDAR
jgi:PAT family beta-lactamase induction signal transducer AmpG